MRRHRSGGSNLANNLGMAFGVGLLLFVLLAMIFAR